MPNAPSKFSRGNGYEPEGREFEFLRARHSSGIVAQFVKLSEQLHSETVKIPELADVPPGVVTVILPVFAPLGTVAVIWIYESTLKLMALTPPKVTLVSGFAPSVPLKSANVVKVCADETVAMAAKNRNTAQTGLHPFSLSNVFRPIAGVKVKRSPIPRVLVVASYILWQSTP
jgi:hypothetical protein